MAQELTEVQPREDLEPRVSQPDGNLLRLWVLAGLAPEAVTAAWSLLPQGKSPIWESIALVLFVITIGLAQWAVLRRYLPLLSRRAWLVQTALGWIAGFLIAAFAGAFLIAILLRVDRQGSFYPFLPVPFFGFVDGAVLGRFQWRVLSQYIPEMPRKAWVLANAVGAAASSIVFQIKSGLFGSDVLAVDTAARFLGAIIAAGITGLVLAHFLRLAFQQHQQSPTAP